MKTFKPLITLACNSRGCWIMDTIKGCGFINENPLGCYDECYAAKIAARYRIDFGRVVLRRFADESHFVGIVRKINSANMQFIRIGEMGDPSWNWDHTLSIIERIRPYSLKEIVVITKHWQPIPERLYGALDGVCINTSVSAMDSPADLSYRLGEYEKLRGRCESVLRVVTCSFNTDNERGALLAGVQDSLLNGRRVIETVFRPGVDNAFVADGVINCSRSRFLGGVGLSSLRNGGVFFGRCDQCPDMCGINSESGEPVLRSRHKASGKQIEFEWPRW